MKILLLGHCSYYTISNFTKAIKENYADVQVSVADPVKPGNGKLSAEEKRIFDEILILPQKRKIILNRKDKNKSLFEILKNKSKRKEILRSIFSLRYKSVINQINSNAEERKYSIEMKELLKNYDIYHYHYLAPEYLTTQKYLPEGKKVLMTFWGSDLFQISGVENYKTQFEALNKSDLITVNTIEVKETALSKFGRNLDTKMRFADFGLNKVRLELIESRNKEEANSEFRKKYNIPPDKIIITIGYSGSSKQRHIEILKILNKLDKRIRDKIYAVLPLTYGLQFEEKNYLQRIQDECEKVNFGSLIISEFMPQNELIDFIISSEIKLNLRDTDAMNAAMLESLFAGNIVINGAWLPYGKLRRFEIYYREIEKLSEIENEITYIADNLENEKNKTSGNSDLIKKYFLYENIFSDWKNIYDELYKSPNKKINVTENIKV